jgi:hypothetical protein
MYNGQYWLLTLLSLMLLFVFKIYLLYFSAIFQNKLVSGSCNLCGLGLNSIFVGRTNKLRPIIFSNEKIDWGR